MNLIKKKEMILLKKLSFQEVLAIPTIVMLIFYLLAQFIEQMMLTDELGLD